MAQNAVMKIELEIKPQQTIHIPEYSKILNVKNIDDYIFIFVLVNPKDRNSKMVEKTILMYDTNYLIEETNVNYINTVEDYRKIERHVFERLQ